MWDVIGHERQVEALRSAIETQRLPHALLFTGPSGTGKTALAVELAKALNCVGNDPPDQVCVHCKQIAGQTHPDVWIVERAEGRDNLTIQQVRELREMATLRPYQGRHKVYIVAGAEALTLQAADALLKILEEPQPQVTIVLTATDLDALPSTVVSRCWHLPLRPVDVDSMTAALTTHGLAGGEARRLAFLSRGKVGWALRAASQPKLVEQQVAMLQRMIGVLDLDLAGRLETVEALTTDRRDRSAVRRHLELLLLLARDLMMVKQGLVPGSTPEGYEETLRKQADRYSLAEVNAYMQALRVAMVRIDANVDPRLALEAALVGMT